mgnify:CR=1 FL=1
MAEDKGYKNIFKTTFLFGFVQVFNILVRIGTNKAVALLLGAEGMGIIGLFNSAIGMLKTGAGLGISQSAVRDISEANGSNDEKRFSRIISLTNKVIIFTSLLGIIVTIILSPFLSKWSFGNNEYIIAFIWLSIVVGLNILSEGQLAILKGMRQLRALAKASMIGSVVGLITAVPFYYFFGKGGIVPSLIIIAFSALFFSNYFVRKIKYERVKLTWKEIYKESSPMVKMGIALMLVSFLGFLFDLIVSSYISNSGGLADVGFYHAGTTIINGYFGIVITAMSTDYYPRISAVHNDNLKLTEEMNKQSETGLIMVFPLVILFVFIAPYFIQFLYSSEFIKTTLYTDYAILGTILIIVSNCMGMILLAKQASKVFLFYVILQRVVLIFVYIFSYKYYGLTGLGFSYVFTGLLHLLLMNVALSQHFKISLSIKVYKLLSLILLSTIVTIFTRKIEIIFLHYLFGSGLFLFSIFYSHKYMKKNMNIDIIAIIKNKLKK